MTIDFSMIIVLATFLLAGLVKGVIGLGLPTVSLAILTVAFDLPTAMALLLLPSFATNLWQALIGGNARLILKRSWPFLLPATATVWLGAKSLEVVPISLLSALLGALLAAYAAAGLYGLRFSLTGPRKKWAGALFGLVNGVLTGMTGSFVVPGVIYLQALGFDRDALIQSMGILFTLSTLALALALHDNGLLGSELALESAVALMPAIAGMALGQRIRGLLSEALFRRWFYISLLAIGAYIIVSALGNAA